MLPATSLAIAQAMVDDLEDYLFGDQLFRQLIVRTPQGDRQPKMTIGALLDRLHSLEQQQSQLSLDQQMQLQAIRSRWQLLKSQWGSKYAEKVLWELKSLLDSWTWYMDDCASGARSCAEDYKSEVWIRVRVEELLQDISGLADLSDTRARLAPLDARLKRIFLPGTFIWSPERATAYPKEKYWFMYGKPITTESW